MARPQILPKAETIPMLTLGGAPGLPPKVRPNAITVWPTSILEAGSASGMGRFVASIFKSVTMRD